MRRIRFTRAEINMLLELTNIPDAAPRSEGDFQEWTEEDYDQLDRVATKLAILSNRQDGE